MYTFCSKNCLKILTTPHYSPIFLLIFCHCYNQETEQVPNILNIINCARTGQQPCLPLRHFLVHFCTGLYFKFTNSLLIAFDIENIDVSIFIVAKQQCYTWQLTWPLVSKFWPHVPPDTVAVWSQSFSPAFGDIYIAECLFFLFVHIFLFCLLTTSGPVLLILSTMFHFVFKP